MPRTPPGQGMLVGRAYTVKFESLPAGKETNISAGTHYIDALPEDCVLVLSQPPQSNACFGGIMAARAHQQKVAGVLVDGRIRDLAEMYALGLPVLSRGTSIVGAGAGCKPKHVQVPVTVGDLIITPGDLILIDAEGICVVPQHIDLDELCTLMAILTAQDEKVKEAVMGGMSVYEAFQKYR